MFIVVILALISMAIFRLANWGLLVKTIVVSLATVASILFAKIFYWNSIDKESLDWMIVFILGGCGLMWFIIIVETVIDTRARLWERALNVFIYPVAVCILFFSL